MREAIRGSLQPAASPAAARRTLSDPSANYVVRAATAAASCVSTWLCWAQFERQQQQEAQGGPAAAGEAGRMPPIQRGLSWALGGESSSAVLLEVLRGHCLLLREGVRELQAVTNSWAAAQSGDKSSSIDPADSSPGLQRTRAGGRVRSVDVTVSILRDVKGMLLMLMGAAAVDSGVLQQASSNLFGLAGTLEQLVRIRCACHSGRLLMDIDWYMLHLLHLLLGSQDLSAFAGLRQGAAVVDTLLPRAAAAACSGLQACGLLPYLVLAMPLGGQQQRQLLGLLFSSLKLFSTYHSGDCAFSLAKDLQDDWLSAAGGVIRAACMAGRLFLVTGGQGGWGVATLSPGCSQAAGGSASGRAGQDQREDSTRQGAAGGQGSSCHSCGLGAEGTAVLLPWVVLQGRALQLWVALLRAYVQLPPAAADGSQANGSKGQDSRRQPNSLVGSAQAVKLLAAVFKEAVAPSTQVLAAVLQGRAFEGGQPREGQCSSNSAVRQTDPNAFMAVTVGLGLYGVPLYLWPPPTPASCVELQQQLTKHWQQLLGHCREQGLDLSHLEAAGGSAASAALRVLRTLAATGNSLRHPGASAQTQHRLRQSDIRRYLKLWEVADAAVLQGVLAMLSGGEHSAAGVAVAAWLCSPSIAGDLLAQLQEFSSQLSTLPIHEACNNPACRVTAGSREQGLVSGKACVCAGCRMGHYCSRACQREHWPLHQLQCGAAAAAAARNRKQ